MQSARLKATMQVFGAMHGTKPLACELGHGHDCHQVGIAWPDSFRVNCELLECNKKGRIQLLLTASVGLHPLLLSSVHAVSMLPKTPRQTFHPLECRLLRSRRQIASTVRQHVRH